MAVCPKCGRQEKDGTNFCSACGASLEPEMETETAELVYCPQCGAPASAESTYCRECGAALREEPHGKKTFGWFIGAAVAAVLLVAVAVSLVSNGKGGQDYALYLKNGEIGYTEFGKDGAQEISQRLFNGGTTGKIAYAGIGQQLGNRITLRGNTLFYPDRCEVGTYGSLDRFSLYYRDVRKPDAEGERIDSDINYGYQVNESGTLLTYTKGSDSVLYQHDLKERVKVASGVMNYWCTEDGKTVAYLDQDGNLYRWSGGESEKVSAEVQYVYRVSEDLSTFYYERDGGLYVQRDSEDRAKIASEVNEVQIYDSGEVCYTVLNTQQFRLSDYVSDSLKDADAAMTEPVAPVKPDASGYGSDAAFESALAEYDAAASAYKEAQAAYEGKLERDKLREELATAALEGIVSALYYYDGEQSVLVSENMADSHGYAADKAVGVIRLYKWAEDSKVDLSEVRNLFDLQEKVRMALFALGDYYVLQGQKLTPLERESAFSFYLDRDGSQIAFLDEMSDENTYGELFRMTVGKDGAVSEPERYDSDVSSFSVLFCEDGTLRYFKEVDNSKDRGVLYLDREQVDYDVYLYSVNYVADSKTVYYFTDWDGERGEGTLKFWANGRNVKAADEVHAIGFTSKKQLLYLTDFSSDSYKGALYRYDAKEPVKIDDDVAAIIPIYD